MVGALVSLVMAFLVALAVLYLVALAMSRHYESNHREYKLLRHRLPRIIGDVHHEADRWPMYSRPVLFTQIDHKAQVEFSQVHKAIDDVERLVPQIDEIHLPAYPEQVQRVFAVPQNVHTIVDGILFLSLVKSFALRVLEILHLTKRVSGYLKEEQVAKDSVLQALDALESELKEAQSALASPEWSHDSLDHISWILLTAQQCHDAASERIKNVSGDGLEYAVAHIYIRIGNASLDYYRAYKKGLEENKRYELDTFGRLITDSHQFLQSILENESFSTLVINDLNNWRKLRGVEDQLDDFPRWLQMAVDSLDVFRQERDAFETWEGKLEPVDLEKDLSEAKQVQDDCSYYWYSPTEKPAVWQDVLAGNKLPTETLSELKSNLIADLRPVLTGATIRQSVLPELIRQLQSFFARLEDSRNDVSKLAQELNLHKESQAKVQELLDRQNGRAGKAVSRLEAIRQDTSPDIQDSAVQLIQLFKIYEDRATSVRGADFPDLLTRMEEFVTSAGEWIDRHDALLGRLADDYVRHSKILDASLGDIARILTFQPRVEEEVARQLTLLENAGRQLRTQFHPTAGYRSLNRYRELAETWEREAERYVTPTRERIQIFTDTREQALRQLRERQSEIDAVKQNMQTEWRVLESIMLPEVERIQRKLDATFRDWNRRAGRNWTEMHLRQATEACGEILARAGGLRNELQEAVATLSREQRTWQERETTIRKIADRNLYRISEQDRALVIELCNYAKEADSRDEIKMMLEFADQIVRNTAPAGAKTVAQSYVDNRVRASRAYFGGNVTTDSRNTLSVRDYLSRSKRETDDQ